MSKVKDLDQLIKNDSLNKAEDFFSHLFNSSDKTNLVKQKKAKEEFLKPNEQKWFDAEEKEGQLAVDIYETSKHIKVVSTLAGAWPEDIEINIQNDLLTIKGKRKFPLKEKGELLHQECFWGNFSRTIILPSEIDEDKVKANFENGLLIIILPKLTRKNIKIEVKE